MAAGVLATIIAAVQFGTAIEQIMPDSYLTLSIRVFAAASM
jgi:hypothetical protein